MKKRNLLSGFVLAAFMALGLAGTAYANDYTGTCASYPGSFDGTGNVNINQTGACNLPAVTAGGFISVISTGAITTSTLQANGGDITLKPQGSLTVNGNVGSIFNITAQAPGNITITGAINANGTSGAVKLTTTGAATNKIKVTGNINAAGHGVSLVAQGTIQAGTIDASSPGGSHDLRLFPNQAGGATQFVIGTSGTNGVTALKNNSTNGGTGVEVQAGGTGGIKVAGAAIDVSASAARAGGIILDAGSGTITATGHLSVDGVAGQSAGIMILNATTITTTGGAQITANDQGIGQNHYLTLNANTINYTGGLTASANGANAQSGLYLAPKGSTPFTIPQDPAVVVTVGTFADTANPLTITGTGVLNLNAKGPADRVNIVGTPLIFSGAAVNITAEGSSVTINGKGSSPLKFDGSGAFTINTSTAVAGQAGGDINIFAATSMTAPVSTVTLNANGGGDGGNITLLPGTANIKLGTKAGDFKISSDGGASSGSGGSINVNPLSGSITIDTANAVSAKVPGTTGSGGKVTLFANGTFSVNPALAGTTIDVNGKGANGNGGNIKIVGSGNVTIGSAAGALSMTATGSNGTGNGGNIELDFFDTLTLASDVSVAAGTGAGSNGNGGTLKFNPLFGFTLSGTRSLNANSFGTGTAGSITAVSLTSAPMVLDNATISASGDIAGAGTGGQLSFTNSGPITVANATFNANGGGTGGDAGSVTLNAGSAIDVSTAHINAIAPMSGNGKGGTVSLNNASGITGGPLDVNNNIKVDGKGTGATAFDGSVALNGVTCQQWKTPNTTWPLGWWECVTIGTQSNPGTPTAIDSAASTVALNASYDNIRALFATSPPIQIYTFGSSTDYQAFFKTTIPVGGANASGYTTTIGGVNSVYAAVFENGAQTLTEDDAKQVAAHELGHGMDFRKSDQSNVATYLTYVAEDYLFMDYITVGANAGSSTPRNPCIGTGAPFAGINDESTGVAFCMTYSGSPPSGYTALPGSSTVAIESKYMPGGVLVLNSQIAQTSSQIFTYTGTDAVELYAQTFGYLAYIVSNIAPANFLNYTANALFANTTGYFQCTQDWADDLLQNHTTPPTSTPAPYPTGNGFVSCGNVPAWYRSQLGH